MNIEKVIVCEVLDLCGNFIVEVEVYFDSGFLGWVIVFLGVSIGSYEVFELCDGGEWYMGKGVECVVQNVCEVFGLVFIGMDVSEQVVIDKVLMDVDGIFNKGNMGGNVILVVSFVIVCVVVVEFDILFYCYFGGFNVKILFVFMMNVINGGVYVDNSVDFQEFMVMLVGVLSFCEVLCYGVEIFYYLKKVFSGCGYNINVGDEGGFVLDFKSNEEVFEVLFEVIQQVGYEFGKDICIVFDFVVIELYKDGQYYLESEGCVLSSDEMIDFWVDWISCYLIVSIEDGFVEDDWDGWECLIVKVGVKIQLVGDDLFVINFECLQQGIDCKVGNVILVKVNQIGFFIESMDVIEFVKCYYYGIIISYCLGEFEDVFIVDFVVVINVGQIKIGLVSCLDCIVKYNQLLCIEDQFGD